MDIIRNYLKALMKKSTDNEILEKVGKGYKEREYEKCCQILLNDFPIFSDKLEQTLFYIFGKDIQTSFNVYLIQIWG